MEKQTKRGSQSFFGKTEINNFEWYIRQSDDVVFMLKQKTLAFEINVKIVNEDNVAIL